MKKDRVGAEGVGRADSGRECRGKKDAGPWMGEGRGEGRSGEGAGLWWRSLGPPLSCQGMFEPYLKSFYIRSNDPTQIKILKVSDGQSCLWR